MEQPAFSLFGSLAAVRGAIQADLNSGIAALRELVVAHPLQGFEVEIVGRLLRETDMAALTALPSIRVAVLASHTSEPFEHAVRVSLLREGFAAHVYQAPYGSWRQELLDSGSGLYAFQPDAILVAVSLADGAVMPDGPISREDADHRLKTETTLWRDLWNLIESRLGKPVLQHLAEIPAEEFVGVAERRAGWSGAQFASALNERLLAAAPSFVRWIDVDRLAARVGRQNWRDPRLYHHARLGFATRFLPEYTAILGSAFRSALGIAKKALVLDLDNTLWGGVIGDDRLDGIRLGPENAEGAAFQAFCRYVKALGQRGVILGICSKNELDIAREVFDRHPHMPLSVEDFAVIRCNWNDKATNLELLARDLNIDLSAIVFVDDNPAECERVRQVLPQVRTVLLGPDPAMFVRELDQLHLFDAQALSEEDLTRRDSYKGRAKAMALQTEAVDLDSYLASMNMTATIRAAEETDLPRLAQMEMKTNQFNLATRRLTSDQLRTMLGSDDTHVLVAYLSDRFAEHGLVSYVATVIGNGTLVITDWLMSCRVFSRGLEHLIFNRLVEHARSHEVLRIEATLVPTAKNKVMEGLFESLGFTCAPGGTPPAGPWEYTVTRQTQPLKTFVVDITSRSTHPSLP